MRSDSGGTGPARRAHSIVPGRHAFNKLGIHNHEIDRQHHPAISDHIHKKIAFLSRHMQPVQRDVAFRASLADCGTKITHHPDRLISHARLFELNERLIALCRMPKQQDQFFIASLQKLPPPNAVMEAKVWPPLLRFKNLLLAHRRRGLGEGCVHLLAGVGQRDLVRDVRPACAR